MSLSEEEKRKISQYKPDQRAVEQSHRTKIHAGYLRERLHIYLRGAGQSQAYGEFLSRVEDFSVVACENRRIWLPTGFEFKATPEQLSGFMGTGSGADTKINKEDFAAITFFLDYIGAFGAEHRGQSIADKFDDPLFHSLLHFLSLGELTLTSLRSRAPGWYRAYRPSSTFPGCIWVGILEVFVSESGAVCTREFYQSNDFDGRPNKKVDFSGYLIRKGRHHSMLTRSDTANSLCLALMPSIAMQDNEIVTMAGAAIDISTGNLWGGRILYDRIFDVPGAGAGEAGGDPEDPAYRDRLFDAQRASCRVVPLEEAPVSVAAHFRRDGLTLY